MSETTRFAGAPTRQSVQTIDAARRGDGVFDIDMYHVIERRDDELIRQEILYGQGSSKFVYSFPIKGSSDPVAGISVVGARHLAAHYGGLKHKLIGSVMKTGSLFVFTSYPQAGVPMHVEAQVIAALSSEPDYYEVVVEVEDIKKGNTIQVRKMEAKIAFTSSGTPYTREHYSVIAESKAYRNAVLALIDQGFQIEWKVEMLKLKKDEVITGSVLEEKRSGVLRFAASKSIPIDRPALEALTFDQLSGLGDAARAGGVDEFRRAADAVGVLNLPRVTDQIGAAGAGAKPGSTAGAAAAAQAAGKAETKPGTTPEQTRIAETQRDRQRAADDMAKASQGQQEQKPSEALKPTGNGQGTEPVADNKQPAPATERGFLAYVADEDGTLADDETGGPEVYRDPVAFLRSIANRALSSGALTMLLDNNADSIEEARKLAFPPDAQAFDDAISALLRPTAKLAAEAPQADPQPAAPAAAVETQPPPAPDLTAVVLVPQKGNRPDLKGYQEAMRAALAQISTQPVLTMWQANNRPSIETMPTVTKRAISQMIADRAAAIYDANPPTDAEKLAALKAVADDLVKEVEATATSAACEAWTLMRPTVLRSEKLPEDLQKMVQAAWRAHRDGLKQRGV